ncbi:2Fe-2S iron-sulfur cluster-binding protein [Campylobacter jejuni]|nr:2Fe-2S iron-sulfur cluster-binding protein [Campylobacter jejuni]MCH3878999.1 2Fe-2S iron-sulfur cluster-binding protein [Campylobacter jejuni]
MLFIKKTKDITLNFTVSCQSAICGACAVRVNGILILLVILKCKIC